MFRGFGPVEQPLPDDLVWRDGQLLRYSLEDGWEVAETYMGEWDPEEEYEPGDAVLLNNGLWLYTPEHGEGTWCCLVPFANNREPAREDA